MEPTVNLAEANAQNIDQNLVDEFNEKIKTLNNQLIAYENEIKPYLYSKKQLIAGTDEEVSEKLQLQLEHFTQHNQNTKQQITNKFNEFVQQFDEYKLLFEEKFNCAHNNDQKKQLRDQFNALQKKYDKQKKNHNHYLENIKHQNQICSEIKSSTIHYSTLLKQQRNFTFQSLQKHYFKSNIFNNSDQKEFTIDSKNLTKKDFAHLMQCKQEMDDALKEFRQQCTNELNKDADVQQLRNIMLKDAIEEKIIFNQQKKMQSHIVHSQTQMQEQNMQKKCNHTLYTRKREGKNKICKKRAQSHIVHSQTQMQAEMESRIVQAQMQMQERKIQDNIECVLHNNKLQFQLKDNTQNSIADNPDIQNIILIMNSRTTTLHQSTQDFANDDKNSFNENIKQNYNKCYKKFNERSQTVEQYLKQSTFQKIILKFKMIFANIILNDKCSKHQSLKSQINYQDRIKNSFQQTQSKVLQL